MRVQIPVTVFCDECGANAGASLYVFSDDIVAVETRQLDEVEVQKPLIIELPTGWAWSHMTSKLVVANARAFGLCETCNHALLSKG